MASKRNPAVDALRGEVSSGRRPDGVNYCAANGCPLGGTWSYNTREGGPWWCFVHSAAQGVDLPAVTARIRSRGWMIALIFWINGMDLIEFDRPAWRERLQVRLIEIGREDLMPKEGWGKGKYHVMLRRQVIVECTEGLREFSMMRDADGTQNDGWTRLVTAIAQRPAA